MLVVDSPTSVSLQCFTETIRLTSVFHEFNDLKKVYKYFWLQDGGADEILNVTTEYGFLFVSAALNLKLLDTLCREVTWYPTPLIESIQTDNTMSV
jgi:hypothetical protein